MRRVGLSLLLLAGLVAAPSFGADADRALHKLAATAGQRDPLVRIGLDAAHSITVSGEAFRILDPASGKAVWRKTFDEEIQIVAQGGPREGSPSVFRIQVGAFGDRDSAQRELKRLEGRVEASGVIHHDPDRAVWRVRLGAADDRLALNPLMERLRDAGLKGLWIAEEPLDAPTGVRLRLVDGSFESHPVEIDRLVVVPEGKRRVRVDGKRYRGVVEVRLSPFGTVRPINWVEVEQYLLGVVPAELGPEVWPELAALKAQAVAARTYVWENRGQFEEEGFDLCGTPRCQVYAGADAEHPLSDRAVALTRGEIMTHDGEPISALYTATCGGHTEAGGEIFPEHDKPYLQGVPCRAEGEALATQAETIEGRAIAALVDETGADVTWDWTLLEAVGVIGSPAPVGLDPVDGSGLRAWTAALCRLAGRPEPVDPIAEIANLSEAIAAVVGDLQWSERARVLLSDADVPALLRDPDTLELDLEQRRALAYLALTEALRPFPDGRFHADRAASWARIAPALVRIGESYEAFDLRSATVVEIDGRRLRMVQGKGRLNLTLAAEPALFARLGGKAVAVERLELWPGDIVQFRTDARGAVDLLELRPPVKGVSDDRSSRVYSWEVRKTRRQLEVSINRRVSIGRLENLEIVRRGVSGRVVELRVVGDRASTVVRGFDVRRLLDLRESLVVVEPQRDAKGRIEAIVFAGKGWGHGVGLCQVGAYGMALRGASYDEILTHYYPGAAIESIEQSGR